MATTDEFLTLGDIVKTYLLRRGDNTTHNFTRFFAYAVDGLAELNFDGGGVSSIKTVELELNQSTMSVNLPKDYISYTKIGFCKDGNVWTLGLNENMCTINDYGDCGDILPVQGGNLNGLTQNSNDLQGTPGWWFYNYGAFGRIFGAGGGYNRHGYYKVDLQNRRIRFNSDLQIPDGAGIILEYVSSGYEPGVQTLVHPFKREALIAWLNYQDVAYKRSAGSGEKDFARRQYGLNLNACKNRLQGFTWDEFYQACRTNFKRSPKN